ncbi:MAG: glycosyltransferase family 2 protein, partial [Candidatus Buchananbacteria bacterium]
MPKISIIIPAYNCSRTINQCLESVFNQAEKDLEVIVVNDGSKEDLAEAVKPWLPKIKYIVKENGGAPSARNRGFDESSGDFVIFLDADIIMKPSMISKLLKKLNEN